MLELLLKIAQEKVGCDFDYYKGYNLLKDSLEGLDEQTINKLLTGEYSLKYTDNNKGEVVDVPQTNPLNILSLIECKLNSIADAYKDIQFGQFVYWKKSITIDITDYIKLTDSSQNYITTLLDDPIIYAYNSLKESLDKDLFTFANISIIIEKLFPNNTDISDRVSKASKQLRETIYKLNHPSSIATLYDKGKLDRYIITQLELDKLSEIHPSLLCCNAGYFAPDGKYYGLNGTKANFLHIKIADLLQQQGIISKDCNTPDRWLEEHGWIKQSGSMLLYGGYFYNISITKEQITSIERILSQSYNYIELQHIENSIPVTRLSEIENIQLRKHFS